MNVSFDDSPWVKDAIDLAIDRLKREGIPDPDRINAIEILGCFDGGDCGNC
jgi:hypothetical protein